MAIDKSLIEGARFSGKKDKYDAAQVDEFLEKLAATIDAENLRTAKLEESLDQYKKTESSLASALVFAEENSKRIIGEAEQKAAGIIKEAEDNAEEYEHKLQASFEEQRTKLVADINALKAFKDRYRAAIAADLDKFAEQFKAQEQSAAVWEERPDEIKEDDKAVEQSSIDLNEILSNLPETDSELKEMIDGLI